MESRFYSRGRELPWRGIQFERILKTAWLIKNKKNVRPINLILYEKYVYINQSHTRKHIHRSIKAFFRCPRVAHLT